MPANDTLNINLTNLLFQHKFCGFVVRLDGRHRQPDRTNSIPTHCWLTRSHFWPSGLLVHRHHNIIIIIIWLTILGRRPLSAVYKYSWCHIRESSPLILLLSFAPWRLGTTWKPIKICYGLGACGYARAEDCCWYAAPPRVSMIDLITEFCTFPNSASTDFECKIVIISCFVSDKKTPSGRTGDAVRLWDQQQVIKLAPIRQTTRTKTPKIAKCTQ